MLLLMGLGGVVCSPVLAVGDAHRLGDNRRAVWPLLPLYDVLNCPDVLSLNMPRLEVRAGAGGRLTIKVHRVEAVTGLRRHQITILPLVNPAQRRNFESPLFSGFHARYPPINFLNSS